MCRNRHNNVQRWFRPHLKDVMIWYSFDSSQIAHHLENMVAKNIVFFKLAALGVINFILSIHINHIGSSATIKNIALH
jgi:hypothetical protein